MVLIWMSRHSQVVAADVMVIPRSCSCSIQSFIAVPSWTSPILWGQSRVIKDTLSRRSFSGIDMGHDANI